MSEESFSTRHNVMNISSVNAFMNVKGGMNRYCKDVYFVRIVGGSPELVQQVEEMDRILSERTQEGKCYYIRQDELPKMIKIEDADYYSACYAKWADGGRRAVSIRMTEKSEPFSRIVSTACKKTFALLSSDSQDVNLSIEKNFIVKILYWLEHTGLDSGSVWNMKNSVKFVVSNIRKKQEYLFCYFLTLLGIDVLLLQVQQDIDRDLEKLNLSQKVVEAHPKPCVIPEYEALKYKEISDNRINQEKHSDLTHKAVNVRRPERDQRTQKRAQMQSDTLVTEHPVNSRCSEQKAPEVCQELQFEELAQLASSVVMIAIHNRKGDVIGTGSGIMIGKNGFILTNNHVASGGVFYSVRIEEDEQIYETDEVIKYNPVLDLAVIRIDRTLKPLPLYRGEKKLVRGQKVVAIGSPLGLFNSVSDGIISGFRKIDGVDMIQFTAPISHGSSGGAVLNMYGEVIGISTAGFDRGQNINLAVGFECIHPFVKGFT